LTAVCRACPPQGAQGTAPGNLHHQQLFKQILLVTAEGSAIYSHK
jgi:hypothetical protein